MANRRVLIVSPHFPPINAPDHQRIRMSLPYFSKFGWEPIVLAVHESYVEGLNDPFLSATVPSETKVYKTKAISPKLTRTIGLGSLGLRALPAFKKHGARLIQKYKIDLVYFSTTMFSTMILGRYWKKKLGVPYILDFQDPWLSDYYEQPGAPPPPGGRFKYGFSRLLAKAMEPYAMKKVDHCISVSPSYPNVLIKRYGHLTRSDFTVLPFGAPENDFQSVRTGTFTQTIFRKSKNQRNWVYVGRGGKDMEKSVSILFSHINYFRKRNPELMKNLHLHFVGTSYAPDKRAEKTIEPLAKKYELDDMVTETTGRIPYSDSIKTMLDCDAIMLIGSDDSSYTASKLYPCILAKKPILAIVHRESSVGDILDSCDAGKVIAFDEGTIPGKFNSDYATAIKWLLDHQGSEPNTNWEAFKPYLASEMTRKQCEIFDRVLKDRP